MRGRAGAGSGKPKASLMSRTDPVRLYPAAAKSRKAKNVKDPLSAIEL